MPVSVKGAFPLPAKGPAVTMGAETNMALDVAEKVSGPVPEASMPPPLLVSTKERSVLAVGPVYCNTPPLRIRAGAAAAEVPMPLLLRPLARLLTLSTPPSMMVAPVYVFALESTRVPESTFTSGPTLLTLTLLTVPPTVSVLPAVTSKVPPPP